MSSSFREKIDKRAVDQIRQQMDGEIFVDQLVRNVYSTDASVYQQQPAAVAYPKSENDIALLIRLANQARIGLIPRTAGTSLAGQVVGPGIVVDVSRHFTRILEINSHENWVRVQPGVIRNELNMALAPYEMFFAPETSTANRAMMGGMLGNNSCGANSIIYGSTRDHTLEVSGFLCDGTRASFGPLTAEQLQAKCESNKKSLEHTIYQSMFDLLSNKNNQQVIRDRYPLPEISRRNTGYALDRLIDSAPFNPEGDPFNLCHLISGSEGTLFFATEIKLRCEPLPPEHSVLLCAHFKSIRNALQSVPKIMQNQVFACELIDRFIIEGAARNLQQKRALSLIEGAPEAVLIVEARSDSIEAATQLAQSIRWELEKYELGYAFPVFSGQQADSIWNLRRAGLGVVANVPGDNKPVAVIEDAAVSVADLSSFVEEVSALLTNKYDTSCVHYGHAGCGELHLRPVVNLKSNEGVKKFRAIALHVARIVKKYRGSLSGEHGDGRLRSELLEYMIGEENYRLLRQVKQLWDPRNIFNPGKIIDAPPLHEQLKFQSETTAEIRTVFDFASTGGMLGAAEMCSGSGDCRKTHLSGGTMCPSYMATRNEIDTTRARANVLRQVLSGTELKPLGSEELKRVMDLCLSCKGCKNECPSNVDMAKLKAEFLQGYYDAHGAPRRARIFASFQQLHAKASRFPRLYNVASRIGSPLIKSMSGIHSRRSLPRLHRTTLRDWFEEREPREPAGDRGLLYFFCDEFTNYVDTHAGIAAVELLERLGYCVEIPEHLESGRAAISGGFLRDAQEIANRNVELLHKRVSFGVPLVGVEPSALLTLVDEYPTLVSPHLQKQATELSQNCLLLDEFLSREMARPRVFSKFFCEDHLKIRLHAHCHQKALRSLRPTIRMLQLPKNYQVKLIPSGCCGMAGSFGYEKEHYDVSMQIGELVLFPTIREENEDVVIAAPGTSCRQQILDGTGRRALHPVEILRDALVDD